ncbi:MAG: hypothetical protein HZA53_07300 [Planctomycetes bacterium]|nr:hypothetical protein [Planctomycetota bacterium]
MVLLLVLAGQALGNALAGSGFLHGAFGWRDAILAGFALCAAAYVWLQRDAVKHFFRSMHTGVVLVGLSAIAVASGVLVPQIEGFEDPDERVPSVSDLPRDAFGTYLAAPRREADQYAAKLAQDHPALAALSNEQVARAKEYRRQLETFQFAEAYFLHHLLHPYGLGRPETGVPEPVLQRLDRFGQRYGKEERDNQEKQIRQAFGGQPKSQAIEQFIQDHRAGLRTGFDVCTALHLNRAYKSHWFATLLFLLAIGVGLNTFRGAPRQWLTLRKAGWLTVHVGILVMLTGGFVSKLNTDRGLLELEVDGPPKDSYYAYFDRSKPTRMPFHVKLDRFGRKDWPTLQVGFKADDFKTRLPEYTLWPGREIGMDWVRDAGTDKERPNLLLRVKALAERAQLKPPRLWEAEQRDDPLAQGPVAEFEVRESGGDAAANAWPLYLVPGARGDQYFDPEWRWRLRTVYGDEPAAVERALRPEEPGYLGWIDIGIRTEGTIEPRRERLVLGRAIEVGEYTLTPVEATAHFQLDAAGKAEVRDGRPLKEQTPRNPAGWVKIEKRGAAAPERRLVLQAIDAETHASMQKNYAFASVALKLVWDVWGVDGPPRHVLQWGPNTPLKLVAEDGKARDFALGSALPFANDLVLKHVFHAVRVEKTIEFLAPHVEGPHFDPDFYATDPIGLDLEIVRAPGTSAEKSETVRFASTERSLADTWQSPDGEFSIAFYENAAAQPFEWRSVLSILEDDGQGGLRPVDIGPEYDREIRVNDYFFYRGYRFFQTNADAQRPKYSGIGVVFDPGIPIVLYGMYTIIVGTILAFLLRPIAEAYAKRVQEPRP